jgi:hypothetical protein
MYTSVDLWLVAGFSLTVALLIFALALRILWLRIFEQGRKQGRAEAAQLENMIEYYPVHDDEGGDMGPGN